MPRHCKLREARSNLSFEHPFGLNDRGVPVFECIRLVCGTVNIHNKMTDQLSKSRYCFLTQTKRRISNSMIKDIISSIFENDLTLDDAKSFLTKGAVDNREFWEDLKAEICLCLASRIADRPVEAFLYLYRIIELVSLALPLVYASSQPDYRKALVFIKSLSENNRDGDLSIFRSFVKSAEKSGGYDDVFIDFIISGSTNELRTETKRQFEQLVINDKGINSKFSDDGSVLSISFSSMPLFFVQCRNRLFHNSQSGQNFKLDALNGASELCKMLIDSTLYWFSLVLIEVVKVNAKRYV
jgi:hypothetical protein